MKRAEEAEKQARIQQLEQAVKELQECITAANTGVPLHGLPESSKRAHNNDTDTLMANETEDLLDDSTEQNQSQPMAKIPKKVINMSTCFNAVDKCVTFVPGWQPIVRGSGLLITMPKPFKEKLWHNEFFSYRE